MQLVRRHSSLVATLYHSSTEMHNLDRFPPMIQFNQAKNSAAHFSPVAVVNSVVVDSVVVDGVVSSGVGVLRGERMSSDDVGKGKGTVRETLHPGKHSPPYS